MSEPGKILLVSDQAPGDVVVWTGVVRDIARAFPGRFTMAVDSPFPALWEGNPHVQEFEPDGDTITIRCQTPLIRRANELPVHFLTGCAQHAGERLGLTIPVSAFRGDIFLHPHERHWPAPLLGSADRRPYWLVSAGGKSDLTIKWWEARRYQQVVDSLREQVRFVQVGGTGDHHPRLEGVTDLRGRTTLRELIQLVAHSAGVLCGVTLLMHLAAAVPTLDRLRRLRPCVVVAGGREPRQWEAYPGHQYIDTIGMLPCCADGGCWKARTAALHDGHPHDSPYLRCLDVVGELPRCMDMISAEEVVHRIRHYLRHQAIWERW